MLDFILLTFDFSKLTLSTIISQILVASFTNRKKVIMKGGRPWGLGGAGDVRASPKLKHRVIILFIACFVSRDAV